MRTGAKEGSRSGSRRGTALLVAFAAILAVLIFLVAITYRGSIELRILVDDERATFERNIDDQGSSLNRVIFAVNDCLLAAAREGAKPDFARLMALGQAVVNHAGIPTIVEPSSLSTILGEDPLFLAERLSQANGRFRDSVSELTRLLEGVRSLGDTGEGRARLGEFLHSSGDFMEELKSASSLLNQVSGAYHAARRETLKHLNSHIDRNLVELSFLAALLVAVSIVYFMSRLSIERELRAHREHLEELVATRTDELAATNARLLAALGEKEVLIKEVYHRVKNNLSMVAALVALQRDDARAENLDQAFEELSQRLGAISLIHEKLYRSADLTNIDFGEYAMELCESLIQSLARDPASISFELESSDVSFSPDTLIPLGLIITELVTNSIKYAFKDRAGGMIGVSLGPGEREGTFLLKVRDDGTPPIDEAAILQSKSLGAVLVQSLAKQIGGNLELDLSGGTAVTISFPSSASALREE